MTNEELLQQAKDQVAKETAELLKTDWKKWSDLSYAMWNVPAHLLALSDRASKLAIQSAREEAANEAVKTLQSIQSDSSVVSIYIKASEAIKKLTAPGR